MRERSAPAGEPGGCGDRAPEGGLRVIVFHCSTEHARNPHAVTGRAGKCHDMRKRRTHIVVEPFDAAAKSAGREHDRAARDHPLRPARERSHRASDPISRDGELLQRSIQPDRNASAAQAVKEPRHQRVAHEKPGAAPIAQAVGRMSP